MFARENVSRKRNAFPRRVPYFVNCLKERQKERGISSWTVRIRVGFLTEKLNAVVTEKMKDLNIITMKCRTIFGDAFEKPRYVSCDRSLIITGFHVLLRSV